MHFLLFGGYLAMLGLLPRALVEAKMPPARVGLAIAAWLTAAAVANYAGPWLSDRAGRRRPVLVVGGAVAGLALGAMAIAPAAATVPLLVIAALGGGCVAPLLFAMPAEIEGVGPTRLGAALGLLTLVGQAGGFLLPTLAGATAQAAGLPGAIGALAVVHLLILAPALGMRETRAARPAPSGALAA
jgi:MFS family permease